MRLLENDSRGKLWGSIRSYSFRPGDRVLHDKFGRGTILMVADNGYELDIEFDALDYDHQPPRRLTRVVDVVYVVPCPTHELAWTQH